MSEHISKLCRTSYFHLHNIAAIRKYLSQQDTQTLIHAFISSRLDFCNSLLYGLPACLISKLQKIQNTAARIVTGGRKYDHKTPILRDLHWLPVQQRIVFKLLLFTYKALHEQAPKYITDLVTPYAPIRNLRSSSQLLLKVPNSKLLSCGDRSFQVAAPRLWNSLPFNVRTCPSLDIFKQKLKTVLFSQHYASK